MAGLGSAMASEASAPADPRADQAAPDQSGGQGDTPASPEEQAQYDEVVSNGIVMMSDPQDPAKPNPAILASLTATKEPVHDLANTTASLVTGLASSAKKAGKPIGDEVLYHAGSELIEVLGQVAGAAGIHDFSEKDLETAWYGALDLYLQRNGQDVDQAAAEQQFGQFVEADRAGKLNELVPGLQGALDAASRQDAGGEDEEQR